MAPTSVLTYGYDNQRSGYDPTESTLTTSNAAAVHKLWSVDLGAVMTAQPVEAANVLVNGVPTNVIYEGTEHGDFYALRASNGAILWQRNLGSQFTGCEDMPDGTFGIGGSGAISFTGTGTGVVYVAGGDGNAHALDLATGAEQSGWPVRAVHVPNMDLAYGAVTLSGGLLYVTSAGTCDAPPYHGAVVAIDTASHQVANFFLPSGTWSGGGVWGPGGVSVDPSTGHVFAATGNALGTPENHYYSEALVELSSTLQVVGAYFPQPVGGDNDFGATPVIFKPTGCPFTLAAAKRKSGALVVGAEGALARSAKMFQMASGLDWQFNGIPAWDPQTQMLYISNSSDSAPYVHGVVALQAHTNCTLSLAWQQSVGPNFQSVSPPTVAGGIVYYGDGIGNTEYAFNAATGAPVWNSGTTIAGGLFAAPLVANGQLVVPAWDHKLYAFGP